MKKGLNLRTFLTMQKQLQHLIFYDGTCGLCDRTVQFLLKIDKHQIFAFAPLQGITAAKFLTTLPENFRQIDSLILVENYRSPDAKIFLQSKAVFRIFWLLDSFWTLIGWLNFLPSLFFDWAYKLIARNRYQLFSRSCLIPSKNNKQRFLP